MARWKTATILLAVGTLIGFLTAELIPLGQAELKGLGSVRCV